MSDDAEYAEAQSWGLGHAMNASCGGYDDAPQPRSFINPRGLSRRQLHEEAERRREMLTPSISINRGGIQWPITKQEEKVRATEDILAEVQSMRDEADRLERMASEREKYGADPFKNGTVLKVDMKYRGTTRTYAYACIKTAGKFWLSGRMGGRTDVGVSVTGEKSQGFTWEQFVAWLAQGDATVWQAGSLKQVL